METEDVEVDKSGMEDGDILDNKEEVAASILVVVVVVGVIELDEDLSRVLVIGADVVVVDVAVAFKAEVIDVVVEFIDGAEDVVVVVVEAVARPGFIRESKRELVVKE